MGRPEVDDHSAAYRVVRSIGSGGMASIFEAVDTRLGHRVALKRLHPHIAARPGAAERFLREGRAAARIRHPHVVQVFTSGVDETGTYLAMELLEGSDLGALLARDGRLGVEAALELLLPAIAGVAAAHEAGVIHRDLKPSNIFVASGPGGRPCPKVVDFGVSKVLDPDGSSPATATDGVLGTAAYMAPEQARAVRDASFQSDQYSLGVILYQCVTGKPPFATDGPYELMVAIMTAPLVPPGQIAEGIPGGFDDVVLRAMSRNPRDRFPSVRAFGAELLRFARERDRLAWSLELHVASDVQAHVDGPAPKREGHEDPATDAPTARDTHVSVGVPVRQHRRVAGRAAGALLAGIALVVGALTWNAWHAPPASPVEPETRSTSQPSAPAASQALLPIAPATPASVPPSSGPSLPPTPTPVRAWTAKPPGRAPAAPPVSATAAPSTSLHIGDNGSPILP